MKLARLGEAGKEIPVLVTADGFQDLRSVITDLSAESLADGAIERIRSAATAGTLPGLKGMAGSRFGPPIDRKSVV